MYSIGFDFGTESCRALLLQYETAQIITTVEATYPHGVIAKELHGKPLKGAMVLQHPKDYEWILKELVQAIKNSTNISINDIKGIGIDFTSCTVLPVTAQFEPLMTKELFYYNPHAYAKLWKSHSAQKEADEITASLKNHTYLEKYGGVISSEWLLPKLLEIIHDDPNVFEEMAYFMEAGDWLVSKLTGQLVRSSCMSGYKGLWQKKEGYLEKELLASIHPSLETIYETKLSGEVLPVGSFAGYLQEDMATWLGLSPNTAVAVSIIDAHSAVVGAGLSEPNELLIVVGTSSCHLLLSEEETIIPGISGVVEDGIVPGLYAYEAGQVAVGDIFNHFVKQQLPETYIKESLKDNKSVFDLLNGRAEHLSVGETGLVALDWHNGNRTPYVKSNFSSVIVGETISTEPHEKYRALVESTAFGTRAIINLFQEKNISIDKIVLAGGIPRKNNFLVQVYADVLQKEITIIDQDHIPALGAAIIGVAAAKKEPINNLIKNLGAKQTKHFSPNPSNQEGYEKLYKLYNRLSEIFGKEESILEELYELKKGGVRNGKQFVG